MQSNSSPTHPGEKGSCEDAEAELSHALSLSLPGRDSARHKQEWASSCLKPFGQGKIKPWSASRPRAVKRKSLLLILRALCSALQCLFSCSPSYSASFQPGQTSKHQLQCKLESIQMLLTLQKWSQIHTKKHCLTDRNMLIFQKLCSIKWQC